MIRRIGPCVIANNSGFRKRMRAARRGLLPPEDMQKIALATTPKALARHKWYRKKMQALLGELSA